ncbi:hypothetical protein N0V90_011174 [Kalmusia sp. IMI 367209]|nr:hypothetical protein N0V90_011174 [Kalmusia sp. IMI 367209]
MIQSAYDYSETLRGPTFEPHTTFPQDKSIEQLLNDLKRREIFEHDLIELAYRVGHNSTPETELFYQVCYEGIHGLMFGGLDGEGRVWLTYGDFKARMGDKETKEAYKSALEQALQIFKDSHAEFVEAREALYRLGMFWYLRGQ